MHLTSLVVERNAQQLTGFQNLLIFGPPEQDDLTYLQPKKVITFDYRVYQSLQGQLAERLEFSCQQTELADYDAALVYLPKAKEELNLVLAFVAPLLQQGAALFLVGEKKGGIASAAKKLDALGSNSSKLDSAKHCQLWQVNVDARLNPFKLSAWVETYTLELNGISLQLATIPGVFSFGRLDPGTELLLQHMFTRLQGRVLDFGCGNGVLGLYTKRLNPDIQLEMVDLNLLALECAKLSCELNGLEAKVYPSNGWSEVRGRVNAVVTNPPFHAGVGTEYQTTENFIVQAKDKMSKHAPLLLVANRFLKYAQPIEQTFGQCEILAENSKFRIYKAFR